MTAAPEGPRRTSSLASARRELLREVGLARAAVRLARRRGDREAERRARSRLLALYSALLRSTS